MMHENFCRNCGHANWRHFSNEPRSCRAGDGIAKPACPCTRYVAPEKEPAAELPSGDALDRAAQLVVETVPYYERRAWPELHERIARLIDESEHVTAGHTEIAGHSITHWHNVAEARMAEINNLAGVVRRRNERIADLQSQIAHANATPHIDADADLRERYQQQTVAIGQLQDKVRELERTVARRQTDIAILEGRIDTMRIQRNQERDTNRSLREELATQHTQTLENASTDDIVNELRKRTVR